MADIDYLAASETAKEIARQCDCIVEAASLDICNKESVNALIRDLSQRYGRIDAVVNTAYPRNMNYGRKLEEVTLEDFCENVSLHLGGYFLVTQQFCVAFRDQGWGNVVNMSSIYGSLAPRFGVYAGTRMTMPVEYAATKSAINHLTRYFAQYFKASGVRVNSLSPGGVFADQPSNFLDAYSSMCASKGLLAPADLVGALLFLLSDASIMMTGQDLIVDDGFSL